MNNKVAITMHISVITLNVNELKAPIKRHRVTEWIRKQDLCICCLQETQIKQHPQTESKEMEKDISHKQK